MRLPHLIWIASLLGAAALWSHGRIEADSPTVPGVDKTDSSPKKKTRHISAHH